MRWAFVSAGKSPGWARSWFESVTADKQAPGVGRELGGCYSNLENVKGMWPRGLCCLSECGGMVMWQRIWGNL